MDWEKALRVRLMANLAVGRTFIVEVDPEERLKEWEGREV